MEKLKIPVRHEHVIKDMQEEFVRQGKMKPIKATQFLADIEAEIAAHQEVIALDLRENWSKYFPGLPYSEKELLSAIEKQLQKYKIEAIAEFKQTIKKQEQLLMVYNWIFKKWDARFYFGLFCSCFSLPFFLYLFFYPSDLTLELGSLGMITNVSVLGFLFFRMLTQNKKEEKE